MIPLRLFCLASVLVFAQLTAALVVPDKRQLPPPPIPTGTTSTTITWTVTTTSNAAGTTLMAVKTAAAADVQWPPPAITVTVNTDVKIVLVNEMPNEEVTLHFHGLLMDQGFVSMDGPEGITQCGVSSGTANKRNTFVYRFVTDKPGTYWIHSHSPGQYPKGLRTPFIVTDDSTEKELYGYVNDYAASVSDWYPNFWDVENKYRGVATSGNKPCGPGIELAPNKVVFNDNIPSMSIRSNAPLDATSYYLAPTQPGGQPQRTRFRFINMSAYSQFFIAFEDHSVHVIEVDGVLLENGATMEKTLTEGFVLGPGQRISVLLQHKTTSEAREKSSQGNPYRILVVVDPRMGPLKSDIQDCHLQPAADPSETMFTWGCLSYTSPDAECKAPTSAEFKMLKFRSMSDQDQELQREPKKNNTLDVPWNDYLHTRYAYPWNFNERLFVPRTKTHKDNLVPQSEREGNVDWLKIIDTSDGNQWGSFDNVPWDPPKRIDHVGLLRALDDSIYRYLVPGYYGKHENTIIVQELGDVTWLLIHTGNGDHPIHLHGHHFYVLYKGFEDDLIMAEYEKVARKRNAYIPYHSPAADLEEWSKFQSALLKLTPEYPMRRDTIVAEKNQFMVLAFVADNPGVWALHCHNDFHARTGMMRQVVSAPRRLRELFGTYNLTSGMQVSKGQYRDNRVEWIRRNIAGCKDGFDMSSWVDQNGL